MRLQAIGCIILLQATGCYRQESAVVSKAPMGGSMVYSIKLIKQLKPLLSGFRKSKGMSQNDVALRLGISQQAYQALESNPEKASVERLFKVLSILGVTLQLTDKNTEQSGQQANKNHSGAEIQDSSAASNSKIKW